MLEKNNNSGSEAHAKREKLINYANGSIYSMISKSMLIKKDA